MDRDFEFMHSALLMLAGSRAPIVVKDVQTDVPKVRRYVPVLSAGDFDLSNPLERLERQGDGCDPDTKEPYSGDTLSLGDARDVVRLIPEDGKPWADALKTTVAAAFGRMLHEWMEANGFTGEGADSAAI